MINDELVKLGVEVDPIEDQEFKESKTKEVLMPQVKQQVNKSEYVKRLQQELQGNQEQFKLENRPLMTQSGKLIRRAKLIDLKK